MLRLAALFHDVGKPKTRAFAPEGVVTFHHHEVVGARMTRERMEALRYPNDDVETVTTLVELHLRFHTYQLGWTDRAVRALRPRRRAAARPAERADAVRLHHPQRARRRGALGRRMDELEARIVELREREELDAIRPELDGNQVMALLGIPPGPTIGRALDFLLELRLDEGPLGEEEATRRLLEWWATRPAG